jgi:hypothetical protein
MMTISKSLSQALLLGESKLRKSVIHKGTSGITTFTVVCQFSRSPKERKRRKERRGRKAERKIGKKKKQIENRKCEERKIIQAGRRQR